MDENIITFSVGSPTDNGGHYSLYYTCGKPYYELWVNLWMSITDDGCKIVDLNACEKFENFSNYLNSESDCE